MKTYKVTDIAKLLNVNSETVKRWIRSGRLKSTLLSNKQGHVIDERDLYEFVAAEPKYRSMLKSCEIPNNTYVDTLTILLNNLINERDKLNDQINKIRTLLEES